VEEIELRPRTNRPTARQSSE